VSAVAASELFAIIIVIYYQHGNAKQESKVLNLPFGPLRILRQIKFLQRKLKTCGRHAQAYSKLTTRKRRRVFIGRQRPKTLTTSFGFTAQTRRLRQPRPAAAAAADQNSSKFGQWGR